MKKILLTIAFFCCTLNLTVPDLVFAGTLIPPSNYSVYGFDSQQTGLPATAAIDGNASTMWSSAYSPTLIPHPHYIILDIGALYTIDKIEYQPRPSGTNVLYGTVTQYEVYVGATANTLGTSVSAGSWPANGDLKTATFTGKEGRYVKIVSLADAANSKAMVVAELRIYGSPISAPPTANPTAIAINTTITRVSNISADDATSFFVSTSGGTGICAGSDIAFPLNAMPYSNVDAHKRAYLNAVTLRITGLPTTIYNLESDSCDRAAFIDF